MDILVLAVTSIFGFINLAATDSLHLRRNRLKAVYKIGKMGEYTVFRETVSSKKTGEEEYVLVVGFRLRLLGSNPLLHWIFQRCCILTTPFWSGFKGFKVKLWMVDIKSKNYLGIYKWQGEKNAKAYVAFLTPILLFVCKKNSVWHRLYGNQEFEKYLQLRKIS